MTEEPSRPTEAPATATGFGAPYPPVVRDPDALDVSDVLRTCAEIARVHGLRHAGFVTLFVGAILGVMGAAIAIVVVVTAALGPDGTHDPSALLVGGGVALFLVVMISALLGYAVMSAGVIHAVLEALRGRTIPFGEMVGITFRRLGSLLGAGFLAWLAVVGGVILCFVPGILAGLTLSLVVPIVLVEGLGPVDAITRSVELTRGHRVEIFLAFLAAYALAFVVQMGLSCLSMVLVVPAMALGSGEGAAGALGLAATGLVYVVVNVVSSIVQQLALAYPVAVVYARRTGIRPEVDAERVAAVFA